MSQQSKEELRRFEKLMHDKGSDGFADGPRPWEHWDESGNQANNRVWEGTARRVRDNGTHSLGHRLLSLLTFLALATLLVGIGGVYYTHMQSQNVAQQDVQPLPITEKNASVSPDWKTGITARATVSGSVDELNVMTAPAAGSEATDGQTGSESIVATDTTVADPAATEVTVSAADETVAAVTPTLPPATDSNVEAVSIETVVTERSVTTTVYTRHPQQDEAEVIAAIETTPPPFVREVETIAIDAPGDDIDSSDALPEVADSPEPGMPGPVAPDPSVMEKTDVASDTTPDVAGPDDTLKLTTADTESARSEDSVVVPQTEDAITVAVIEQQDEPATHEPSAVTGVVEQLIIPVAKRGDWVINLASYTWKSTANKKRTLFQSQGVDAEVFKVIIKDKPMYRVRVTGFDSSREAKAEVKSIEQKLGFEGAWVAKR